MDLSEAVGQMLVVGFNGAGETPPAEIRRALAAGDIGGVILFARNIDSLEQVVAMNRALHEAGAEAPLTPFVAVDQEGGPVMRLRDGMTPIPPMREVGASRDPKRVARVSEVIATEIQALGFNLNFAPVLDVDSNPDNPIIAERAFGSDPEWVGRAGGAFLYGHNMAGVVPCGKHFPGHGDTHTDSHLELPVLQHDRERLEQIELPPFRQAIGADIPMVMTAHLLLPLLDAARPATFSPAVLDDLLRRELGYEGVVVSDDLEMKAVAERYGIEEMIDLGLQTSLDIFLVCESAGMWKAARARLLEAGRADVEVRRRIMASAERVARLKEGFFAHQPRPWVPSSHQDWREVVGCAEHRAMVENAGPEV